jgi:hypothetical protein
MERALNLPGRQDGQIVAELLGSDVMADLATAGCVDTIFFHVVELDLIEVHDGLHYAVLC